jgi:hypothetical protein
MTGMEDGVGAGTGGSENGGRCEGPWETGSRGGSGEVATLKVCGGSVLLRGLIGLVGSTGGGEKTGCVESGGTGRLSEPPFHPFDPLPPSPMGGPTM